MPLNVAPIWNPKARLDFCNITPLKFRIVLKLFGSRNVPATTPFLRVKVTIGASAVIGSGVVMSFSETAKIREMGVASKFPPEM